MRVSAAGLILLAVASGASAQVLTITGGGRRVIDRWSSSHGTSCLGWTYGPAPRIEEDGTLAGMYAAGDQLVHHCQLGELESPLRFGDVIQYHARRDDGTWSEGVEVIGRSTLPWMNDAAFLRQHPETFVGHVASPSVVKLGGRYYMAFAASIDDRNLCAGEHYEANPCGSCFDPWSYFVVMWAVSDDGVNWSIRERSAGDAALLGRRPDDADRASQSQFKGLTRVTLVPHQEKGRQYFYLGAQYWARGAVKILMFRIAFDPDDPWGLSGDPELWSANRRRWVVCPDGHVPDFAGAVGEFSLATFTSFLGSIVRTTVLGAEQYLSLSTDSSFALPVATRGVFNRIAYQTSRNLIDWTPAFALRSAIPFFADGFGYDVSVIDPVAIDAGGVLRLFFASADGDPDRGVDRDGRHDCDLDPNMGPTAPYVGTGIYEAVVRPMSLRSTITTLSTPRVTVQSGESPRYIIRVTAADGTTPRGNVVLADAGRVWQIAPLVDGIATVDLPLGGLGEHRVYAWFDAQAGWDASRSSVVTQTVVLPRRRAVNGR